MTAYWRRTDATAMTGSSLIRWPKHLDNYGGGGTSVYAVWPSRQEEPMEVCSSGLIVRAALKESPLGSSETWRETFPDLYDQTAERREQGESTNLLGILLLGTTGASWALRDPALPKDAPMDDAFTDYWSATEEDLTESGRAVLESISTSYGRQVILLTVQDT